MINGIKYDCLYNNKLKVLVIIIVFFILTILLIKKLYTTLIIFVSLCILYIILENQMDQINIAVYKIPNKLSESHKKIDLYLD